MCVTDRHDMTLAAKVALNAIATNRHKLAGLWPVELKLNILHFLIFSTMLPIFLMKYLKIETDTTTAITKGDEYPNSS